MLRKSVISAFSLLLAVSAFGQSGTQWKTAADVRQGARGSMIGTVSDVSEGQRRFRLAPDDDRNGQVSVETDSVSTKYVGFGGVINGSPEVFVGSTGFANIRVGDRLEVRGNARSDAVIGADYITLLGRPIPADQTGVGQTRTPQSISPPTASGTTPSTTQPPVSGPVEGVVRQVNAQDGRIVIETDRREVITVRGTTSTPVYYRNNVYKLSNLEPGDRIRVEPDANASYGGEVRARTINVVQNVQEAGAPPMMQVGGLTGRVTSLDRRSNTVHVNDGRNDVPVDLTHAMDSSGRQVHAADMQVGDRVDLSGTFNGNVFVATTVHFGDDGNAPPPPMTTSSAPYPMGGGPLGAVTVYGSVTSTLASGPRIVVKDTQNGGTISLYVLEDFAVRTKAGTYTTADKLKEGDAVVVKAYRDSDGDYIAQTIRLR